MKKAKQRLLCMLISGTVLTTSVSPIYAETALDTSGTIDSDPSYSIATVQPDLDVAEDSTHNSVIKATADPNYQTLKINGTTSKLKRVHFELGNLKIETPMEGYFTDNISMVSGKHVLGETKALGIDYSYNSSTKKVTFKRNDATLVYTLDSTKAVYNGKTYTAPAAPRLVYNCDDTDSYVMVPGSFTASKLGLKYKYTSDNRTARLRIPSSTSYQTLNYDNEAHTSKKRYLSVNNEKVSSPVYGFLKENTTMLSGKYAFGNVGELNTTYQYDSDSGKITFTHGDKTLVLKLGSKEATLNGSAYTANSAPIKVYSHEKNANYVMVPASFVATKLGFTYKWDSDKLTANITTSNTSGNTSSRKLLLPKTKLSASTSNYCVRFKRPKGVSYGTATATDDYRNKKLYIYFKGGNYKSFVSDSDNRTVKTSPSSITTSYSEDKNRTSICIKTSSIRGFSVVEIGDYIYVRWAAPKSMFKNILCLDAGHGGDDSGAVGNGYYEKTLNLKIVKAAKEHFDDNANYKVYYTRLSDWYPSLDYRSDLSNSVDADMFVSVHIDSADSTSAGGTSVLYNNESNYKAPASSLTSYRLADINLDEVLDVTNFTGRSDKLSLRNNLSVLRKSKTASSLIEVGFISKKSEAKWINSNADKVGKAVYDSIARTTSKYPTDK